MALIQDLNSLDEKLTTAKQAIADALTAKGVVSTVDDTLTLQAEKIGQIEQSGGGGGTSGIDFSVIGYTDNELLYLQSEVNYSKSIYDEWDASVTSLYEKWYNRDIHYFPLVDTHNVTFMEDTFNGSSLMELPLIDTSNVWSMKNCFKDCNMLEHVPNLNTSNVSDFEGCFSGCRMLRSIPAFDFSSAQRLTNMFSWCKKLSGGLDTYVYSATEANDMFSYSSVENVTLRGSYNITNFNSAFASCNKLTSVEVDITGCLDFNYMFSWCDQLNSITFRGMPNSSAYGIDSMFEGIPNHGTFYYDTNYQSEYQPFIDALPSGWDKQPTW